MSLRSLSLCEGKRTSIADLQRFLIDRPKMEVEVMCISWDIFFEAKSRVFVKTTVGSAVLDLVYLILGGKVCPKYESRDPASRPRDRDFDGQKGVSAGENHPKLFLPCYSYIFFDF